jgi:hypothetical protein
MTALAAIPGIARHIAAHPWPRPGDPPIPGTHWLVAEVEWARRDRLGRWAVLLIWAGLLCAMWPLRIAADLPRGYWRQYLRALPKPNPDPDRDPYDGWPKPTPRPGGPDGPRWSR